MSCNFLNSWVVFLAALSSLSSVAVGIRCLECNELPDGAARSPCPGAALINFGTKFDACIVYRLESGRIVYQEAVDTSAGEHLCSHTPSHLADVIYSNFGESGAAMCCKRDGCNKDMPARFASIGTRYLFLEDFQRSQGEDRGEGGPEELKSGSERISATTTILFSILSGAWMVLCKNGMIVVS